MEQLNLLEEDFQLSELLSTRYAVCHSGVTYLSRNIFPVTGAAMDSGVGNGDTLSAQDGSIRISLWLCAAQRDGKRNHLKLLSV